MSLCINWFQGKEEGKVKLLVSGNKTDWSTETHRDLGEQSVCNVRAPVVELLLGFLIRSSLHIVPII